MNAPLVEWYWPVLGALTYLAALILLRTYNVAAPGRELLRGQIDNVLLRVDLETEGGACAAALKAALDDAKRRIDRFSVADVFFWNRGSEMGAWTRVHEVERQLAAFLVPASRVYVRAQTSEAELREIGTPEALVLADRMRATLDQLASAAADDPAAGPPRAQALIEQLQQQLAEALAHLYSARDTKFAALMEWHNKAMWLLFVTLMAIVLLAITLQNAVLFVIGASGGLMSRMARSLFREDVPNDYGASWTTLFLSPALGAISAWFGVLLMIVLAQWGVLGPTMADLAWNRPPNELTIALAFVLGFSERLFTSLLGAVEGRVDSDVTKTTAPAPQPAGPALPAAGPGAGGGGPAGAAPAGARSPAPAGDPWVRSIVADLDLTRGERVAFVGDPSSPSRAAIRAAAGPANVFDVTPDQVATIAPVDAVLLEGIPDVARLDAIAAGVSGALARDGRLVVVERTPAGLITADAGQLSAAGAAGPLLIHQQMTAAGLLSQEPPEVLDGTDPLRWSSTFKKP